MPSIKDIVNLVRIRQWYKNILVFIGAFFGVAILSIRLFPLLILGFILLCCASSINYIINDIIDLEKDKLHEEKLDKKPLASGALSKSFAILLIFILSAIIFIALIFSIIYAIPNISFMIMVFTLIITGQLYNHFFKNYAFIDIIILSLLYLWRTLAGCILIEVNVSPWLLLAIFELAMFLGIAKRKGDLLLLGEEKAKEHKKVYEDYSTTLLDQIQTIVAASTFMTYALYLIIRFNIFAPETVNNPEINDLILFLTLPVLFYLLIRYTYLTTAHPEIARSTEKVIRDKGMLIAALIFTVLLTYAFYIEAILKYGLDIINR